MVYLAYTFFIHSREKGVFTKIYQGIVGTIEEMVRILRKLNLARIKKNTPLNVLLTNFSLKTVN